MSRCRRAQLTVAVSLLHIVPHCCMEMMILQLKCIHKRKCGNILLRHELFHTLSKESQTKVSSFTTIPPVELYLYTFVELLVFQPCYHLSYLNLSKCNPSEKKKYIYIVKPTSKHEHPYTLPTRTVIGNDPTVHKRRFSSACH